MDYDRIRLHIMNALNGIRTNQEVLYICRFYDFELKLVIEEHLAYIALSKVSRPLTDITCFRDSFL